MDMQIVSNIERRYKYVSEQTDFKFLLIFFYFLLREEDVEDNYTGTCINFICLKFNGISYIENLDDEGIIILLCWDLCLGYLFNWKYYIV